jgi:hypothetical protein
VSRTARLVFQSPASPFNVQKMGERPLPALRFADNCPVYFDRHTLSIKPGQLSLFTMDGRMRFELALDADKLAIFDQAKLREIVLNERTDKVFELSFFLDSAELAEPDQGALPVAQSASTALPSRLIPEYVSVEVTP